VLELVQRRATRLVKGLEKQSLMRSSYGNRGCLVWRRMSRDLLSLYN